MYSNNNDIQMIMYIWMLSFFLPHFSWKAVRKWVNDELYQQETFWKIVLTTKKLENVAKQMLVSFLFYLMGLKEITYISSTFHKFVNFHWYT